VNWILHDSFIHKGAGYQVGKGPHTIPKYLFYLT